MAFGSIAAPPPAPQPRSRGLALAVLCAGMLMIILDTTIVNVALPAIQRDLGFSQSGLAWVVNAYLVSFGGILLLAGRLGDLVGRTRVFLAGLAIFTLASLACGLAPSQAVLVGARIVQGVGGALTSSVVLGVIVTLYPDQAERTRAISIYSFVASAGASAGLLAGGALTEWLNWHWIFFVNVPIGILTAIGARKVLARDRGLGLGAGADVPGAILITSALMLGVYAIIRTNDLGLGSPETGGLLAVAAALLVGFVIRELRARQPLLSLGIFRSRNVTGANLILLVLAAAMFGMFFLTSLYFQRVLGLDALGIGVAFLPVSLTIGVMSVSLAAPVINRFGARTVALAALASFAGGMALLIVAPVHADYLHDLLPALVLFGAGAGLAFPSLVSLAMADVRPEDAGLASGLVNTTRQVGGALGLAILATMSSGQTAQLAAGGATPILALTGGMHLAYTAALGLLVGALAVTAVVLRSPVGRNAEPAGELESRDERGSARRALPTIELG